MKLSKTIKRVLASVIAAGLFFSVVGGSAG